MSTKIEKKKISVITKNLKNQLLNPLTSVNSLNDGEEGDNKDDSETNENDNKAQNNGISIEEEFLKDLDAVEKNSRTLYFLC
ncbi:hypothetical protein YC2023_012824 [Brassica napus]